MLSHAVVMAAGRGERMRPLTDIIPKAMAPFRGGTLISQVVERLGDKVSQVHVTVGYMAPLLSQYLMRLGVSSVHFTGRRSNAWWINNTVLSYLDKPVLVTACDVICKLDINHWLDEYEVIGQPSCMIIPVDSRPEISGDYIHVSESGKVSMSRSEWSNIYCSGVQIVNPRKICRFVDEFTDFNDLWDRLGTAGELSVSSRRAEDWYAFDTVDQLVVQSTLSQQDIFRRASRLSLNESI